MSSLPSFEYFLKQRGRRWLWSVHNAEGAQLNKLLAERMLDSAPTGVRLRVISFSKANAPRTGRCGPIASVPGPSVSGFIFETGLWLRLCLHSRSYIASGRRNDQR